MRKQTPLAINWKALPFIRLLPPFMLGIYAAEKWNFYHFSLDALLCLTFLSILWIGFKRFNPASNWITGVVTYSFFFVFAYQLTYFHNDTHHEFHFKSILEATNTIVGIVESMPQQKNDKLALELRVQTVGTNPKPSVGKLLVYLKGKEKFKKVQYGDQLVINGNIQAIQKAHNPYAFDYGKYLYFQNIHYHAFIKAANWKIIVTNQGNWFWQRLFQFRKNALAFLEKKIPSKTELAVAATLLLGEKTYLSANLKAAYAESGAIHVLAVSGLHVGIISSFLTFLLLWLPFKGSTWHWIKLGLVLLAIWGFALLTGLSHSVQRAAILFSVLSISRALQRDANRYHALAIAAFLILWMNPYALFEVGFQLSFLAMLGIFSLMPLFKQFWIPKNGLLYRIWGLLLLGVSAQIAVLPISLYYFHQVPTYFWLSGLVVVPLVGIILKLGFLLLLLNGVSDGLTDSISYFIAELIAQQNAFIACIQELPFHVFTGFWISQIEVLIIYGILLGVAMLFWTHRIYWLYGSLIALLGFTCTQLAKDYEQLQQKKMIIYSIANNSAIDFIDGQTVYALTEKPLTTKQEAYSVRNSRWAAGVKEIQQLGKADFQTNNLFKKGNIVQFFTKRIVWLNKELSEVNKEPFQCDYLLIQNSPAVSIEEMRRHYDFKVLIFDKSNTYWSVKKWKMACHKLNVFYQDIRQDGAYVLDLDKTEPTKYANPLAERPVFEATDLTDIATIESDVKHSLPPFLEFPLNTADD